MTKSLTLACSALGLALLVVPAAQAMENADGMSKMSGGAMMHKDGMKKKKHKDSMMKGEAMKGDTMMKKDDAAPAQ